MNLPVQQFFQQRMFNINRRFANCPSFVFAAVQYLENKQLTGNSNIAFNRGKATTADDGGTVYTLHDPCSVLDNIKETPRYFRQKKMNLLQSWKIMDHSKSSLICHVQTQDLKKTLHLCCKTIKFIMK